MFDLTVCVLGELRLQHQPQNRAQVQTVQFPQQSQTNTRR